MRARYLARILGRPGLTLAAGILFVVSPAWAQAPATVKVSVDATTAGTAPLERVWAFHGYDEINYTTLPEGSALLAAIAAAHTAPAHVRSHFLLNTGDGTPALKWGSTNVYTEDAQGTPIYSWTLTDAIMDTVTGVGAFPLVEIGFMPQALSTHPNPYKNSTTTSLDGGCFYPPTDYAKWADLISAWAAHANQRYPNVAASWLWELWNEPDIGYWNGTLAEYEKLYDYTESALHQVLPDAQLGGPAVAIAAGSFLPQFLQHCATGTNAVTGQTGTRLDLVSFHAKGGTAFTDGHVEMNLGGQLRLHRTGFKAVAAVSQFRRTPIYVTEADPEGCAACPATTAPEDGYRNSPAYGAYEIAMMKASLDLEAEVGVTLGGLLTWAFTFPGTAYFSGYRALATNGIDLPVMSAFKLLGRLAGTRLSLTSSGALALDDILANGVRGQPDLDGMAAQNGDAIQVLVWNYHDDLVPVAATPVHLEVKLPAAFGTRARVSHLRVDETHGDAYAIWTSQGAPASPSEAQLASLRQGMDPSPLVPDTTVTAGAGAVVALDFSLPRFGVSLVTLKPATDAGDGSVVVPEPPRGGCACRVSRGRDEVRDGATLLAASGLALIIGAWRRRAGRRG